jgi:L-serine dehydratase
LDHLSVRVFLCEFCGSDLAAGSDLLAIDRERECVQSAARSVSSAQFGEEAMTISVFDLFSIGIGPSSSHTVGPMRAANQFARSLAQDGLVGDGLAGDGRAGSVARLRAELFGSLGATGHGHGSVAAVVLGLSGEQPELVDPAAARPLVDAVRDTGMLQLPGTAGVPFDIDEDVILHRRKRLPFHSNAMRFAALDAAGCELSARTYYSVGGGFVLGQDGEGRPAIVADATPVPYPFATGAQLLAHNAATGCRSARSCSPTS